MNGKKTQEYADKLVKDGVIPYLDIYASIGQDCALRYCVSKDGKATGKERLYLYSATKPMTVTCAMRLVEEGKLSLDDEVAKYLPAFSQPYILDGNGQKTPCKNKMTVRHLLTMSAGFTYHVWGGEYRTLIERAGKTATTQEIISALAEAPLAFESGERFEYSLCHDVLAAVIEVASGQRFSAYMQEIIFTPLGMQDSGFHTEKQAALAPMYISENGKVQPTARSNDLIFTDNYDSGGAGVISTVEDYAKFAKTLACGGVAENGYRLLQEQTLQAIYACQHECLAVQNSFTCVQGNEYGYGLGVRVRLKETDWGLPKGEFGWDGAAGTYLMVDPVRKISVVIGMHVRNWPEVFQGEHLKIVECIYKDLGV